MMLKAGKEHQARPRERLHGVSQWRLIWLKFKKNRAAVGAAIAIIVLYMMAGLAECVAPYDPAVRDIEHPSAPPMRVRIFADGGLRSPFVYGLERVPGTFARRYRVDKSTQYPLSLFVRGDNYRMWGFAANDLHLFGTAQDARVYLFGTDKDGRDLLSRIIYGSRLSLSIGFIGVAISFSIGIVLGSISGYFGGVVDVVIQRVIEILSSIPTLPLWMGLSASLPLRWSVVEVFFAISLILSLLGWPELARVVRGRFLSLRTEDFVISARLDGVKTSGLMFRHMLPLFFSHIIATATLAIPGMILAETSLSFLGIGLRTPAISWGVLLQAAQNTETVVSAPWLFTPGIFVVIAVLGFNFLGDGIRDAADPYK